MIVVTITRIIVAIVIAAVTIMIAETAIAVIQNIVINAGLANAAIRSMEFSPIAVGK